MAVQIAVQDRDEAVNLLAVLLAYGTGFKKAGNVLAHLKLSDKYNGNARGMARSQAERLAQALGFEDEVGEFLSYYNPSTLQWEGPRASDNNADEILL